MSTGNPPPRSFAAQFYSSFYVRSTSEWGGIQILVPTTNSRGPKLIPLTSKKVIAVAIEATRITFHLPASIKANSLFATPGLFSLSASNWGFSEKTVGA